MTSRCLTPALAVLSLALALTFPARAADRPSSLRVDGDTPNPSVPGIRADTPPRLDGRLDDPCWAGAPIITGFTRDTRATPLDTEVRIVYTDRAVCVAFTCHDPEPQRIRGQQRKRNGNMDNDDTVSIGIDPRCDKQAAYWFSVNASGTQGEDIPGGAASKVEWRGDWRAATQVTGAGWTAEMEIPFALLRYPRGQDAFGVVFARGVSRLREWSNWPAGTHRDNLGNEARWARLVTPRFRPRPRVMPYVLGGSGTFESSTGVDVKYTTESEATMLLTLRPDFQTIEEAIQDVDFSYDARRLTDRRPFFTEGGDFLGSRFEFHSPNIGKVDAGAKTFGKSGPFQFAGLVTSRFQEETDALGVAGWDPNTTFSLWGGAMSHRWEEAGMPGGPRRNSVWMAAGRYWHPLQVNGVEGVVKYFRSRTTGAGSDGHQFRAEVMRWDADRVLGGGIAYREITPDYDARLSYVPVVGIRGLNGWFHYPRQVDRGPLRHIGFYASWDWTDRYHGGLHHRGTYSSVYASFRNDTGASFTLETGTRHNERASLLSEDGPYNAERTYDDRIAQVTFGWRESDIYRGGGLSVRAGRLAGGPYHYIDAWQGLRFGRRTSGNVSAGILHLDGQLDRQDVWRVVASGLYEFSPERSFAVRVIGGRQRVDGESTALHNAYLAYRQEVRRGADIFVLVGDPNTNSITANTAMKYVVTY